MNWRARKAYRQELYKHGDYEGLALVIVEVAAMDALAGNGHSDTARAFFAGAWFDFLADSLGLSLDTRERLAGLSDLRQAA